LSLIFLIDSAKTQLKTYCKVNPITITMKLHLSILSLSVVAMPVLSTELAKPVDVTFVSDWDDDVYSGGNIDTTSMTSKEKLQLPDLRFFETGQSGNVSMMRFLWNGKYHYEVSRFHFTLVNQADCV